MITCTLDRLAAKLAEGSREPGQFSGRFQFNLHIEFLTLADDCQNHMVTHLLALHITKEIKSALDGKIKKTQTAALLVAKVEGYDVSTNALVVQDIGTDEDAKTRLGP